MTKLNTLFEQFLHNIEPDEDAKNYAQDAHKPIREYLEKDDKFKKYFLNSFLYGSYKRHTAIEDIKDVDIVVLVDFDINDSANTPLRVLRKLKDALGRYYEDPEILEYQRRSIRVNEPLPNKPDVKMTLDIIPAVLGSGEDEPLLVPDRELKEWIRSHPKGHIKHTTKLNDEKHGDGKFVPMVKLLKSWWKHQCELRQPKVKRPKPKGFWVECLTGENFDKNEETWAEHFIAILKKITARYNNAKNVPELDDPGLLGEKIKTSMSLKEFELFMVAVQESLQLAENALKETDDLKSSEIWRQIFGKAFPLFESEKSEETVKSTPVFELEDYSHCVSPLWPLQQIYKVHIDGYLCSRDGGKIFRGINSNARLSSNRGIKFIAQTNTPEPYDIFWQVVNTGEHARRKEGLRGDFFQAKTLHGTLSNNKQINWEYSEYTGKHWIECFIVKGGVCVARSGRFYVNIKNPDF